MNEDRRQALTELADEQAALMRLATLVAEGVSPHEIFSALSDEVAQLFASNGLVLRFEEDGLGIVSVGVSTGNDIPVGARWEFEEGMASLEVYRTGSSARVDAFDWSSGSGPAADTAERVGIVSSVSNPILVQNRLWGAITVFSTSERLPDETEDRLAKFSQLVATAIANAESRDAVSRTRDALELVAAEQAALRRVATLVAQDAAPAAIFAAVSTEVDQLFRLDVDTNDVAGVVRFDPGPEHLVVGVSRTLEAVKLGSRWEPVDLFAPTRVLHTGRSVRVDEGDLVSAGGPVADFLRSEGYLSQVASPIVVGGRLWGAVSVNSGQTLPPDSEERLEKFTELVATAIANAESNEARAELADEQAVLRRVATLIARDAPSAEVFDAVATEVGRLFETDITVVGRYDDGVATAIGNWSASGGGVPVGTRSAIGGHNVLSLVAETGKPARIDGYDEASGEAAEIARRYGWRSSIAAPIIVEDRVWGVMLVATQRPEPFPSGAEERLAAFTDLVATAVANTKSRAEVEQLADEQAALRRVATLVAKEALPEEVFAKVAEETGRLLGGVECTLLRTDPDGGATNVGCWGETIAGVFPVGTHFVPEPAGDGVAAIVLRTGRSYRIDDYSAIVDPVARSALDRGIESAVGCPIVVRGAVWGAIFVTGAERFPPETELRLSQFGDLVATAVANAEARGEIVRLAEEQAAQRRVATLVARGAQPAEIFSAVTEEVGRLFETELAIVGRFEEDPPAVVAVAVGKGADEVEVGSSWKLDAAETANDVFRSRRAVRANESLRPRSAALADTIERLGVASMVASPIIVDGRLWGAVIVPSREQLPADTEERLEKFTDLVGIAIANADGKSELAASRRRIVTASDAERRRIERDLHDGTQQRLVSLGLAVRAAEAHLPPDRPDLRDELSRVAMGLADAVEDLQEISRGIHPAILSKGGLGAAVRTLATLSPIAVDLDVKTEARFAEPVEVAAYFVVSEALANAAKHSQATRIDVSLHQRGGRLRVSIRDDGVGGAEPGRGSGLVGLTDRVAALGGSLTVHSGPGEGTQIRAELPVET